MPLIKRTGIIYRATNTINGKAYIGKTIQSIVARKNGHITKVRNGSNYYFHNAIRKYGIESFEWEIMWKNIPECELSALEISTIKKEATFVDDPNCNGYNLTKGGEGGELAEVTKKKISISNSKLSDEQVLDIIELLKKGDTLDSIAKKYDISMSSVGRIRDYKVYKHIVREPIVRERSEIYWGNKFCLNYKHTAETKAKMSAIHKGKKCNKFTAEHKQKISKAHAKLSDKQVLNILKLLKSGEMQETIAKKYSVCISTISSIKIGKTYKHVSR